MTGEELVVVATTGRQRQAEERALVLQAEGLLARARRTREGWVVETSLGAAERARAILATWERENRPEPEPPPPPRRPYPWTATALLALALVVFFAATGPRAGGSTWFDAGSGRTARILAGEWWRVVTALTLHADPAHVLGNALASFLFVGNVGRRFGAGIGLALVLAAGALGNAANALVQRPGHDVVGASTAVFAAVGVLAADAVLWRRAPRRRVLVALGAAVGIFAMLGTGERADLEAHFLGLAAGVALGLPAARLLRNPPGLAWQALAGALAAAVVAGAWALALAAR